MKGKRIAIFHIEFYYSGGAERLIFEQMKGLEKEGHRVAAFAPVVDRERCYPGVIDQYDIKPLLPQLGFLLPGFKDLYKVFALVLFPLYVLRFRGFDLFIGENQIVGPWMASTAAWVFRKPYLLYLPYPPGILRPRKIEEREGLMRQLPLYLKVLVSVAKPLLYFWDLKVARGAKAILANGRYAQSVLEEFYGREVINCPAGASLPQQGPSSKREENLILLTNRHFPFKKFEYAIEALGILVRKYPDLKLVITGRERAYTRHLEDLVKELGLSDHVVFAGFLAESDLEKLYAQAAVYVYTAPEEDFGMGIVEAMAHGTPVVAWNYAGPTGIIEDGKDGFLAEPYEIADFAGKIETILKDKKLAARLGKAAQEKAVRKFGWETHLRVLEREMSYA